MKSQKSELRTAAELVAKKLDATLEDAVDLGISTETCAVAILYCGSNVLVAAFGSKLDVIAAHAGMLACARPRSVHHLPLLIRNDGRQRASFRRTTFQKDDYH